MRLTNEQRAEILAWLEVNDEDLAVAGAHTAAVAKRISLTLGIELSVRQFARMARDARRNGRIHWRGGPARDLVGPFCLTSHQWARLLGWMHRNPHARVLPPGIVARRMSDACIHFVTRETAAEAIKAFVPPGQVGVKGDD